jgi:hypothetical protein
MNQSDWLRKRRFRTHVIGLGSSHLHVIDLCMWLTLHVCVYSIRRKSMNQSDWLRKRSVSAVKSPLIFCIWNHAPAPDHIDQTWDTIHAFEMDPRISKRHHWFADRDSVRKKTSKSQSRICWIASFTGMTSVFPINESKLRLSRSGRPSAWSYLDIRWAELWKAGHSLRSYGWDYQRGHESPRGRRELIALDLRTEQTIPFSRIGVFSPLPSALLIPMNTQIAIIQNMKAWAENRKSNIGTDPKMMISGQIRLRLHARPRLIHLARLIWPAFSILSHDSPIYCWMVLVHIILLPSFWRNAGKNNVQVLTFSSYLILSPLPSSSEDFPAQDATN